MHARFTQASSAAAPLQRMRKAPATAVRKIRAEAELSRGFSATTFFSAGAADPLRRVANLQGPGSPSPHMQLARLRREPPAFSARRLLSATQPSTYRNAMEWQILPGWPAVALVLRAEPQRSWTHQAQTQLSTPLPVSTPEAQAQLVFALAAQHCVDFHCECLGGRPAAQQLSACVADVERSPPADHCSPRRASATSTRLHWRAPPSMASRVPIARLSLSSLPMPRRFVDRKRSVVP